MIRLALPQHRQQRWLAAHNPADEALGHDTVPLGIMAYTERREGLTPRSVSDLAMVHPAVGVRVLEDRRAGGNVREHDTLTRQSLRQRGNPQRPPGSSLEPVSER